MNRSCVIVSALEYVKIRPRISRMCSNQGLYSLSGKTSYRKISWSLEATRFGFKLFQSLWNLAGNSAALLPRCLLNFRGIRPLQHPISRLRDFMRFGGKTSYRLVNRGPGAGVTVTWYCSMWSRPYTLFALLSIFRDKLPNSKRIVLVSLSYIEIDLNFLQ